MSPLFADTVFWYALLNQRDQYRERAIHWKAWVKEHEVSLVTTELVLWELLNLCSPIPLRQQGLAVYRRAFLESGIRVEEATMGSKEAALALFGSRLDKSWSLTDCFSFNVMRELGLAEALTSDHHFEQAGFRPLLLQEPP